MIAPRWRKVLRDLWSNKTRTIIVLLSIAIGVSAIGMVMGSQSIIDESLPEQYAAVNPASGTIFAISTFDDDMIAAIESMPEVELAEGRRLVNLRFQTKSGEWRSMQVNAIPDFDDVTVNMFAPEEGAYPPPHKSLLIERASFAASLGLGDAEIGDVLTVEAPNGKTREMPISGSVHDISQLPAFMNGSGYGYISFDTLEWLGEPRDYNQVNYVVAENKLDQDHITVVGKQIQDRLEKANVAVIFTLIFPPGEHPAQNFLSALSFILGAVGLLSLILSSFLIVNTLSAILTQQVRQIGIMKAIGARTPQITEMYFVMVALFGVMALFIAVPLGALGAVGLASLFAGLLNFDIGGFQLEPRIVLIQAAIGLTAPLLAAIVPIFRGVTVSVREAISEQGMGKGMFGRSAIDRFIVGLRKVVPMERPTQISLRNTFRRKARLSLTLITLSLASAIFISIFSVRASLTQTLDDALQYFDYDVQVIFDRAYRTDRIQKKAFENPEVKLVETWGFASARRIRPDETESDSIIIYAPEPDTEMLNPTLIDGRWLRADDTNAIVLNTDVLRNDDDIEVGDIITLTISGKEREWLVVGLMRGVLTGPIGVVNFDYFGKVTNAVGRAQVSLMRLADRSPELQSELGTALEDSYRNSGFKVQQMQTIAQLRAIISTVFNVIILFLLFMAVLLGLVGGLGLMGTMSINVLERTREIGVMRAVGASDRSVLRIVLIEGLIIGLISWLVGGLIALPASNLLTNAVGQQLLQAAPTYIFSTSGAIMWLVIILILAVVASFLPARGASRLTVREVLSYE